MGKAVALEDPVAMKWVEERCPEKAGLVAGDVGGQREDELGSGDPSKVQCFLSSIKPTQQLPSIDWGCCKDKWQLFGCCDAQQAF